ncbi:MAG: hypothetical protein Phyf2KO_27230 [Phycisphaerales bacterium]
MAYRDEPYEDEYLGSIDDELDPEGPSGEDLRRLDKAMSRCPSCGSEIYDDTAKCPTCGEWIGNEKSGNTMWTVVGVVVLIVFVLAWVL